jgi:hypothetical protein
MRFYAFRFGENVYWKKFEEIDFEPNLVLDSVDADLA